MRAERFPVSADQALKKGTMKHELLGKPDQEEARDDQGIVGPRPAKWDTSPAVEGPITKK